MTGRFAPVQRSFSPITRVPGHTLRHEGAAHVARDCCASDGNHGNRNPYDWEGHAFCSCGAYSPHLPSNGERKRWHREHKAAVVAGAVEGGDGG